MVQTKSTNRARGLRYLLLLVMISWAAFSLLARHFLSDVSGYTQKIENLVSEKTPYTVSVSQLKARWVIFSPIIELENVVLYQSSVDSNLEKNPIITISQLAIELDIIESVFTLSPRIKRLLLNGVSLNLIQDPETKKIAIKGLVSASDIEKDNSEATKKILNDFILTTGEIYLKDIKVGLDLIDIHDGELILESLNLDNEWFNHKLATQITLNDGSGVQRRLRFASVFQGNPLEINKLSARNYIELENNELGFWVKQLKIPGIAIHNVSLASQIWFDISQGILEDIKLSVNATNINFEKIIPANEASQVEADQGDVNQVEISLAEPSEVGANQQVETSQADPNQVATGVNAQIQSVETLIRLQAPLELSRLLDKDYLSSLRSQHATFEIKNLDIDWDDFHLNNFSALAEQLHVEKLTLPLSRDWDDFKEPSYLGQAQRSVRGSGPSVKGSIKESVQDKNKNAMLYRVVVSHIPLGFIKKVSPFISALESKQTLIDEASPQGALKDLQVAAYISSENVPEIYASTYASNIGISSLEKIPSISGIDFYAELAPQGLGVELLTKDAKIEENFNLFRKDLNITQVEGNLFLERLSGDIVVHSDIVKLQNDWVEAGASVSVSIPDRFYLDATKEIPAWSLQVSFKTIPSSNALMFFPGKLPPAFLDWLDSAVLEGSVEGDVMLFAFVKKRDPDTFLVLDGDLNVAGLKLDYLPGKWPQLNDVQGQILVHNDQVKANVLSAKMFDSKLYNASVFIPSYLNENLPRVKVQGNVSGSLQDVQKLFLESELKDSLGTVVEDWVLSGEQNSTVNMDLPISDSPNNYESILEIDLSMGDGLIAVPNVGLGVKELKGDVHYSLAEGLTTKEITAKFFDKEVRGHIKTTNPKGNQVIQIFAKGTIDSQDLTAWQDFWVFDNLQGTSSFDAIIAVGEPKAIELVVPTIGIINKKARSITNATPLAKGNSKNKIASDANLEVKQQAKQQSKIPEVSIVRVDVTSDLKNLAVNLPGAYAKDKAAVKTTRLQLDVLPESMIYRLDYGKMLGVSAKTDGDNMDLDRARINFGNEPFPLPTEPGITVTGHIDYLDYDTWLAYFEKNLFDDVVEKTTPSAKSAQKVSEKKSQTTKKIDNNQALKTASDNKEYDPASVLNHMDLSISNFFGFDQTLKDLKIYVTRDPFLWRLEINNEVLAGLVLVPDEELITKDNPIVAKLNYLKISEEQFSSTEPKVDSKKKPAKSDVALQEKSNASAEGLKPDDFSFMKLDIDSVTIDKEKHGRWQLDVFPDKNGVDFSVHQLNYGLMAINGTGRWDYRDDYSMTRFKGHVRTGAITKIFSALSLRPSSDSGGLMAIDIKWPGSPFDFDSDTMKGTAGLEIFDGSIIEVDINSKKFKALGIFNLGIITDVLTLKIFKKIGKGIDNAVSGDKKDQGKEKISDDKSVKKDE